MANLVDSKQQMLPVNQIVTIAVDNMNSKFPPAAVIQGITAEYQQKGALPMRYGNTLFLCHKGKDKTGFFRALNAMGITGVSDPGGYNLEIEDYRPLQQLWREKALTLRVRYSLSAPRRDRELEDFKTLTQTLPMGSGDDWLRFNGIGENVTWGHYNNDTPKIGRAHV